MTKLITTGRTMFAIGMIALGFLCIVFKDFIIGRPPAWPENFSLNPGFAYITAFIVIVSGIAILIRRNIAHVAMMIAQLILFLSVFRHLPQFMNDWLNAYKAMALAGGSLIVACSAFDENTDSGPRLMKREGVRRNIIDVACMFLAAFFIASGYAHFKFAEFVKTFIPAYIPFHGFFTYFCGLCLIAGGIGLLVPGVRKWAALLSGVMVGGWFLLLHIPRFLANVNDKSDTMGLAESFTFAGIFFVLAGISWRKK